MGKVIFLMNVSLDGYIETPDHSLDWTIADDELLAWFNDQTRSIEALVYGRRLYELMNAYWPTAESDPAAIDRERAGRSAANRVMNRYEVVAKGKDQQLEAAIAALMRLIQGGVVVP